MEGWGGKEGYIWHVSCEFNCRLCPAKLLFGLHFAVHMSYSRTSCSGGPAMAMLKKSINITWSRPAFSCLILLFAFFVFHIFSVLWKGVWSAGAQTHRWSCLMTEFSWKRNCGNSLTLSSVFSTYTHMLWQRSYCHSDTLSTLSARMALFL